MVKPCPVEMSGCSSECENQIRRLRIANFLIKQSKSIKYILEPAKWKAGGQGGKSSRQASYTLCVAKAEFHLGNCAVQSNGSSMVGNTRGLACTRLIRLTQILELRNFAS